MKTPSRYMPKYVGQPLRWYAWPMLLAFAAVPVCGLGYLFLRQPFLALPLLAAGAVMALRRAKRESRYLDRLIESRTGESICEFARSFERRRVDTWVIRAVYEQLQFYLRTAKPVPIRAGDLLTHDLRVDDEDLEQMVVKEIAERTGRSMTHTRKNPYFGKVRTVADLVHFVNEQPKAAR